MLGLLYKDFFSAKKELLITAVMATTFVIYNAIMGQAEMLGPTIGVLVSLGSMMPSYSLHYDKTTCWNKFICASPISRLKVVLSKYLAGIVSTLLATAIIVLNNAVSDFPIPLWSYPLLICLILLIQSVMMPISLKLGQNALTVVFLLLVFIPTGVFVALNKSGIWTDDAIHAALEFLQNNAATFLPLGILLLLALYAGSFFLTYYFYKKMEF